MSDIDRQPKLTDNPNKKTKTRKKIGKGKGCQVM